MMLYFPYGQTTIREIIMQVAEQGFDQKFNALQVVARMAYDYIEQLQPGDKFFGLQVEAAKHFDVGSEGYGQFIGCALHHMSRFAIDFDGQRRIVSIARVTR
jgi:hypothetical protein